VPHVGDPVQFFGSGGVEADSRPGWHPGPVSSAATAGALAPASWRGLTSAISGDGVADSVAGHGDGAVHVGAVHHHAGDGSRSKGLTVEVPVGVGLAGGVDGDLGPDRCHQRRRALGVGAVVAHLVDGGGQALRVAGDELRLRLRFGVSMNKT
jgi:hypothetical protein